MHRGYGAIAVAVGLALVSLNCARRFGGLAGLVAYLVIAPPLLALALRYAIPFLLRRWTSRAVDLALAAATLAILVAAFAQEYPRANSGEVGPGSDRDDALNIANAELLAGQYPYYQRTYLNAPLTPMPGAVLLATPFYLLGNAAYQNVFWMIAFCGLLAAATGSLRLGLLTVLVSLLGSPELLKEYVIGGDFGTNALYVLILTQLLGWGAAATQAPVAFRTVAPAAFNVVLAAALGLAMSSRPNFALLLPVIFVSLRNRTGWRRACAYMGVTVLASAAVTLPFYLYDPKGFSPLHVAGMVGELDEHIPHAGLVVYGLAMIASLGLAARQYARHATTTATPDAA